MKKNIINIEKKELSKLIKISDPFLMIDRVVDLIPGQSGVGMKSINNEEWFYKSHFIDEPVMPGTLQVESMLQTIVSIVYSDLSMKNKRNCLITKSTTNFYSKICTAGDLKIEAKIIKNQRGAIEAKATVFFNNKKTSDGLFKYFNPDEFKIK
jgi:3-hydroxyacyl-[acyl-carrier-protein] dehydratase